MHSHPSHAGPTAEERAAMPKVKVVCNAFERNPDGTWVSTKNSDIQTPEYTVRVNPGILFKPGRVIWGVNVVEALEQFCSGGTSS